MSQGWSAATNETSLKGIRVRTSPETMTQSKSKRERGKSVRAREENRGDRGRREEGRDRG